MARNSVLPFQVPLPQPTHTAVVSELRIQVPGNPKVIGVRQLINSGPSNEPARIYWCLVKVANSGTVGNILPQVTETQL